MSDRINYKKEAEDLSIVIKTILLSKAQKDDCRTVLFEEALYKDNRSVESIIYNVCFDYLWKKNYKKNCLYLKELYKFIKLRIDNETSSREIFLTIEDAAKRIKKKVSKNEITESKISEDKVTNKQENNKSKFDIRIERDIDIIISSIEESGYTMDQLRKYEEKLVNISKGYFKKYEEEKESARAEIIGSLNIGYYGKTLSNLKKYLREQAGPINSKSRLVEYMDENLLRYRIALLELVRLYETKTLKEKNKDLSYIKKVMYNVGKCAREKFSKEYDIVPEEALIDNIKKSRELPGQMEIDLSSIKRNR